MPEGMQTMPPDTAGSIREVPFGTKDSNSMDTFCDNRVVTSKYTILTFVPLNLFEQFQKAANVYFLLISIAMFIGECTNLYMEAIKAYSTFLVLGFMMCVSAVMSALDDYRRHKSDDQMNDQPCQVVACGGKDPAVVCWSEVRVGDILVVRADEEFPADIVLLACSGDEGNCYVSTANLDGETNLKLKSSLSSLQTLMVGTTHVGSDNSGEFLVKALAKLQDLKGHAQAEKPNNSIHNFSGSLRLSDAAEQALGSKQLLLRGTRLRNTAWCIGLVVYTGKDTRVVLNSRKPPLKISNLEYIINQSMAVIFLAQCLLATVSDVFYCVNIPELRRYWYLFPAGTWSEIMLPEPIGYWITFFILYSNMMPISLYATIEFCNAAQALYIKCDAQMYDSEFDFPAAVRSTNLIQELGQVRYIFSDKTGTLTQNVMELKRVCIAGKTYGHVGEERGFFGGPAMEEDKQKDPSDHNAINGFLEVLSVAHTVMVTTDKKGKSKFEAESPDEDALVSATARLGWAFSNRQGQTMCVEVSVDGKPQRRTYSVLALNAFTSSRKRMSVVIKRETGEYYLFAKGADNVMLDRAASDDTQLVRQLTDFAREGLRTLVIGRRKLQEKDVIAWCAEYEKALVAIEDRDGALERVAEKIEKRLELLGATAIEDKLQAGVAQSIVRLRRGGIKLWVLTGDKLETSKNIGFSTQVLTEDMNVLILDVKHGHDRAALDTQMQAMRPSADSAASGKGICGLMVTGQALELILGTSSEENLLYIATRCSVVIACRVSPLQKAQMVQLVRKSVKPTPVTLAIGDGANDVPMIQEAQVGIGICGREGRQAVNAADFAIGQFRFLQRLLLVHGRLDYLRTCKFILYTFWRNVMQVLLMFYYSFMSGFSGISLFEDKVRMTFNVILFLPIVATGIFDRDIDDELVLKHSELYDSGRLGLELNPYKMMETVASALVHSLGTMAITTLAFPGMDLHQAGDYYSYGTAVYSILIIASNYRVAFMTITWNWVSIAMQAVSFTGYTIFLAVYNVWRAIEPPMYSAPYHMASNLSFWVCCAAVPALLLFLDTLFFYVWKEFWPSQRESIQEKVAAGLLGKLEDVPKEAPRSPCTAKERPEAWTTTRAKAGASPTILGQASPTDEAEREGFFVPSPAASNGPPDWAFVQERLPSWQFILTWRRSASLMILPGALLLLLGAVAMSLSRTAVQIRVQYDGKNTSGPLGTSPDEVYHRRCPIGDSCEVTVTVPRDMKPPILVYYSLEPFFQNYNQYVRSVINAEMRGQTLSSRQTCKDTHSATFDGEKLLPCGLRALSLFNDTFVLLGQELDKTGIAWRSDLEYYANPPDYPTRPNTSWLFRRNPGIPNLEAEGVKNPDFATWMRPSAMPTVRKPYGFLGSPLKEGDTLTVRINASFPVDRLGARKELVLTTLTDLGGRDDSLGLFLLIAGSICITVGLIVVLVSVLCPRAPGFPRSLSRGHYLLEGRVEDQQEQPP